MDFTLIDIYQLLISEDSLIGFPGIEGRAIDNMPGHVLGGSFILRTFEGRQKQKIGVKALTLWHLLEADKLFGIPMEPPFNFWIF